MAILTTNNLAQSFGAFDLFSGISVSIPKDGKVGLVGPNGIGKTTFLLILAGQMAPSAGSVQMAKGTRFGYLRQEAAEAFSGRQHTVYDARSMGANAFGLGRLSRSAPMYSLLRQANFRNGPKAGPVVR